VTAWEALGSLPLLQPPTWVVLDVMMAEAGWLRGLPGAAQGIRTCRSVHAPPPSADVADRITGLELGADDFTSSRPFSPKGTGGTHPLACCAASTKSKWVGNPNLRVIQSATRISDTNKPPGVTETTSGIRLHRQEFSAC